MKADSIPESKFENFLNRYSYIFLFCILGFICFLRFRLLEIPLERDEGEYAYMGQLLLEGIPPYKLAFNMKLPGVYFIYSMVLFLFGQTIKAIHIGFLIVSLLNCFLIFAIIKRFFMTSLAIFVSLSFGVYATSPYILGFAFHATHLMLFFFLIGNFLLLSYHESNSGFQLFGGGIFLGLSFLMKQQAIFLLLFAGVFLIFIHRKKSIRTLIRDESILIFATLIPFLFTCLYLWKVGVFKEFWFWTFSYASKYVGITSLPEGWKNLSTTVLILSQGFKIYWISAGLGIFALPFIKMESNKKFYLYSLLLFSFLTTAPGLYFREHYFVPFLPSLIIFSGLFFIFAISYLEKKISWKIITALFLFLIFFLIRNGVNQFKSYYFKDSPEKISRSVYGANPFNEVWHLSEYIKKHTLKNESIFVLGSEPQTYFYTNRKSASGFIYMYPLMEEHPYAEELQIQLLKDLKEKKPKMILFVNPKLNFSWGITKNSSKVLLKGISFEDYHRVAIAEILSLDKTEYIYDREIISNYKNSTTDYFLELYERN
jgi:hypothetical protein